MRDHTADNDYKAEAEREQAIHRVPSPNSEGSNRTQADCGNCQDDLALGEPKTARFVCSMFSDTIMARHV
jgi:hypothetical protein